MPANLTQPQIDLTWHNPLATGAPGYDRDHVPAGRKTVSSRYITGMNRESSVNISLACHLTSGRSRVIAALSAFDRPFPCT